MTKLSLNPQFVTHSLYAFDYSKLKFLRRNQFLQPYTLEKFGLSINGAYSSSLKPKQEMVFFFDFQEIKERVKPVIYLPLSAYTWYFFDNFDVTWIFLAWEMELTCHEKLPLRYCYQIYIPKRKRKLRREWKELGFEIIDEIPLTHSYLWSKEFRELNSYRFKISSMRSYEEKRKEIWNEYLKAIRPLVREYNMEICKLFGLDYSEEKFFEDVFKEGTKGLDMKCRTCKYFHSELESTDLSSWNISHICKARKKKIKDLNSTCSNWQLDKSLFILEEW